MNRDLAPDRSPLILCYGEVLWDCLPQGLFLGGAPLNVAYHLRRLGCTSEMVSAVGSDLLGNETKRRLQRWGFETGLLHTDRTHPTGTVQVDLSPQGHPVFEIIRNVAWDHIRLSAKVRALAPQALAVVYGSLAQRSSSNRDQLHRLFALAQGALRIFDVNLRPPFDSLARVWKLSEEADVIKLNDTELKRLHQAPARKPLEQRARWLAARTGCHRICVTAGDQGAGALWEGRWYWEPARKIEVVDTVGAGDAFLAGFLAAWTTGQPIGQCLKRACRRAEYVAGRPGAQPE